MSDLINRKNTNVCIVGNGDWGRRVSNVAKSISRFSVLPHINSSTDDNEKHELLSKADLVYIATPPEAQKNYIDFCLSANKDVICETPFLCTKTQRESVYKELYTRDNSKNIFYVNYPYISDSLFIGAIKIAAENNFSFFSVKCSGPKYAGNPMRAKKVYSNQAINIIIQLMAMKTYKFDKIIMHNNDFGELFYKDSICVFAWGHSEIPMIEINIKGKDFSFERKFTYDELDQIYPLLVVYLTSVRSMEITPTTPRSMSINTLQHSLSAEHLSDLFVALDGKKYQSTFENLIFSGKFKYE
jgi:hypothetical protein